MNRVLCRVAFGDELTQLKAFTVHLNSLAYEGAIVSS